MESTTPSVPNHISQPDYSGAIQEAIVRSPPGDYNGASALLAVSSPNPTPQVKGFDWEAGAILAVKADIRALDKEVRNGRFTEEELRQKSVERMKLVAELSTFQNITPEP